jgi:hypothetical protein
MLYLIQNLFKVQSDEEISMYNELKRIGGGGGGDKFTFGREILRKTKNNSIRITGVPLRFRLGTILNTDLLLLSSLVHSVSCLCQIIIRFPDYKHGSGNKVMHSNRDIFCTKILLPEIRTNYFHLEAIFYTHTCYLTQLI